jgi:general secretion pathway protein N
MKKGTLTLAVAVYCLVLLITAPASIFSRIIFDSSHGRVELANAQGTIWRGAANPVIHQPSGSLITLRPLHWNIALLSLLSGKLTTEFRWEDEPQQLPMRITLSPNSIELSQVYIPLPALLINEVSDFLKPAQLRGQVVLRSDLLTLTENGVQGTASADWLNASSLISNIAPLGNYHLTLFGQAKVLAIELNTVSGALLLTGKGRFSAASGFSFQASAQAEKGKEVELNELLNHLGPEESAGVHTFNLVR